jgi:hypothetical protein
MISRFGSGYGFPEVRRVRQVESGPAARSSSEARQAGTRAAAVVRISAEARAQAAAGEAEARAAAATPEARREVELEPVAAPPLSGFYGTRIGVGDVSSAGVTLEHGVVQKACARPDE